MNNNLDLSLSQLNLNRDQSQIDSLDGVSTMGGDSSNSLGSQTNRLWDKFADGMSDVFNKAQIEKMQQQRLNYKSENEIDSLNQTTLH